MDEYEKRARELVAAQFHSLGYTVAESEREASFQCGPVFDAVTAALRQSAAQVAVPEGYVLVPVNPTEAMLRAGVDAGVKASPEPWCPAAWGAMLAAAPKEPGHE